MARSRIFNTHLTTAFRLTLTPLRRMLKCRRWVNNRRWQRVELKSPGSFSSRPNAPPGGGWNLRDWRARHFPATRSVTAVETGLWETCRISAEFARQTLPPPEPAGSKTSCLQLWLWPSKQGFLSMCPIIAIYHTYWVFWLFKLSLSKNKSVLLEIRVWIQIGSSSALISFLWPYMYFFWLIFSRSAINANANSAVNCPFP